MKTRSGFVSNSSSSSFVILGCKVTPAIKTNLKTRFPKLQYEDSLEEESEWLYRVGEQELDLSVYYTESGYLIGKSLAEIDDYFMSDAKYSEAEIKEIIAAVKKKLGEEAPIKLMMGTRPT